MEDVCLIKTFVEEHYDAEYNSPNTFIENDFTYFTECYYIQEKGEKSTKSWESKFEQLQQVEPATLLSAKSFVDFLQGDSQFPLKMCLTF